MGGVEYRGVTHPTPPSRNHNSGQYAFYWNAFLFMKKNIKLILMINTQRHKVASVVNRINTSPGVG